MRSAYRGPGRCESPSTGAQGAVHQRAVQDGAAFRLLSTGPRAAHGHATTAGTAWLRRSRGVQAAPYSLDQASQLGPRTGKRASDLRVAPPGSVPVRALRRACPGGRGVRPPCGGSRKGRLRCDLGHSWRRLARGPHPCHDFRTPPLPENSRKAVDRLSSAASPRAGPGEIPVSVNHGSRLRPPGSRSPFPFLKDLSRHLLKDRGDSPPTLLLRPTATTACPWPHPSNARPTDKRRPGPGGRARQGPWRPAGSRHLPAQLIGGHVRPP